jgi:ATP-dependent exoDNAse (exonuclease V) beta subunit
MIRTGVKVFRVGDDKQSIFRFRGADVQHLNAMQSGLSTYNIKTMEIAENFRADPPLIGVVNRVFRQPHTFAGQMIPFPHSPLKSPPNAPAPACEKPFELLFREHIVNVVQRLLHEKQLNGQTFRAGDIAVLCRNNANI